MKIRPIGQLASIQLSEDVIMKIYVFLPWKDLRALTCVSRYFKKCMNYRQAGDSLGTILKFFPSIAKDKHLWSCVVMRILDSGDCSGYDLFLRTFPVTDDRVEAIKGVLEKRHGYRFTFTMENELYIKGEQRDEALEALSEILMSDYKKGIACAHDMFEKSCGDNGVPDLNQLTWYAFIVRHFPALYGYLPYIVEDDQIVGVDLSPIQDDVDLIMFWACIVLDEEGGEREKKVFQFRLRETLDIFDKTYDGLIKAKSRVELNEIFGHT